MRYELEKRSIFLWIFLSVLTLGICLIVWIYKVSKETIRYLKIEDIDTPALNLLFLIITLGVYLFWWNYKISRYISTIERRNDIQPDLLAPIFSMIFGIILHQSRLNMVVSKIEKGQDAQDS